MKTIPTSTKSPAALLFAALSLLQVGCGEATSPRPGYTTVTISGGNRLSNMDRLLRVSDLASSFLQRPVFDAQQTTLMSGGIMVYFQGVNGTVSAYGQYIGNEYATNTLTLQNGTYKAYSLGYTQIGMIGSPKCGVGNFGRPITFNGSAQTVSFVLDDASCAPFTSYHYGTTVPVPPVILNSCARVQSDLSPLASQCSGQNVGNVLGVVYQLRTYIKEQGILTYTSDPSSLVGIVAGDGSTTGLPNGTETGTTVIPPAIMSPCNPVVGGVASPLILPTGIKSPPFHMPVAIFGFPAAACSGVPGVYQFHSNLIDGLATITRPDGTTPVYAGDISSKISAPTAATVNLTPIVKLYLRDFSAGSGPVSPVN